MSLLATQITLLLLVSAVFWLLLRSYRRTDAMEESLLCSILLLAAGMIVPDVLLLFPFVWWAFTVLWADNLRVYLASAFGILFVAFYAAVVWVIWPESAVVGFVQERFIDVFHRTFCLSSQSQVGLVWLVITAVAAIFGLWALIAHLSCYSSANVQVQTRLLVAIPFFVISLLSSLFPTRQGNGMLSVLAAAALFIMILWLANKKTTPRRGWLFRRRRRRLY